MLSITKIVTLFLTAAPSVPPVIPYNIEQCSTEARNQIADAIDGGRDMLAEVLTLRTSSQVPWSVALDLRRLEQMYFGDLSRDRREYLKRVLHDSWKRMNDIHWICQDVGPDGPDGRPQDGVPAFVDDAFDSTVFVVYPLWVQQRTQEEAVQNRDAHWQLWTSRSSCLVHEVTHTFKNAPGYTKIGDEPIFFSPCPDCETQRKGMYGAAWSQYLATWIPGRAFRNADNFIFYILEVIWVGRNAGLVVAEEHTEAALEGTCAVEKGGLFSS